MSQDNNITAEALKKGASKLIDLLRIRTLPIGMKLFGEEAEMMAIKGIRVPTEGFHFTMCQMVGQVRTAGFTLGIRHENTRLNSNCGGIVGLNRPSDTYLSGEHMDGVWFENREAARAHQAEMIRVEPT